MCERPPKHFHPLLQKEKELQETLHRILPEGIANSLSPKSSRLAHLHGLPKAGDTPGDFIHRSPQISAIKFAGIRQVCSSLRFSPLPLRVASKINQPNGKIYHHMTFKVVEGTENCF